MKIMAFASDIKESENIVGKGENAGYHHFLLFPQCIPKAFFSGSLKLCIVWWRVKEDRDQDGRDWVDFKF